MILAQKEGQTVTQNLKQVDTTPELCILEKLRNNGYNLINNNLS
jgi:hypothetical protein